MTGPPCPAVTMPVGPNRAQSLRWELLADHREAPGLPDPAIASDGLDEVHAAAHLAPALVPTVPHHATMALQAEPPDAPPSQIEDLDRGDAGAPGAYSCVLRAGSTVETRKLIVAR